MANNQDRGIKTGKQYRKPMGEKNKSSKGERRKCFPLSVDNGIVELRCHFEDELRSRGFAVTVEVCRGNVHSIADPICRGCMNCKTEQSPRPRYF